MILALIYLAIPMTTLKKKTTTTTKKQSWTILFFQMTCRTTLEALFLPRVKIFMPVWEEKIQPIATASNASAPS